MESAGKMSKKGNEEKLNIVLFAIGPDQEYANVDRREYYTNAWDNSQTYDQHSYEQAYNQNYNQGGYTNFYNQSALRNDSVKEKDEADTSIDITGSKDEETLGSVLKIRKDGFVHNFTNEGIFYADQSAVALLERLSGRTIKQVKLECPNVATALML